MASWGRLVEETLTGTASIDEDTGVLVGTDTEFLTELEIGNLVSLDNTLFKVVSITNDETAGVLPLATEDLVDEEVLLSQAPKYLTLSKINNVVLVQADEIDATTRADGIKTPGWTLYEEYGTGRKRVETLVAMKQTTV